MLRGGEYFYRAWLDLVTEAVEDGPVLDIGTPAPFHKEMAALGEVAARPVWCVDVIPSEYLAAVADGHHLPFRDRSIGSVLLSHVLEHVAEPSVVMREVERVLRPGGKAYVTLLDRWPYHAKAPTYRDYYRFKKDAVDLLFRQWRSVRVVEGGGRAQTFLVRLPPEWARRLQPIANFLDRRRRTSTAVPVRYVLATR